jgi:hypothetical protein
LWQVAQFSSTGGWSEHVRTALVGVARVALVIDRRLLQHRRRDRAVRVVAVGALDLAFDDRVVRRLEVRCADRLVALPADLRLLGRNVVVNLLIVGDLSGGLSPL